MDDLVVYDLRVLYDIEHFSNDMLTLRLQSNFGNITRRKKEGS